MATDLTVILTDEPGQLAKLGQATGDAGVNIQGMCAFTGEGRGIIHVLVADSAVRRAVEALEQAGMGVADQRPVLVVDVDDRPGSLGDARASLQRRGSTSSCSTPPSAGSSWWSRPTTSKAPARRWPSASARSAHVLRRLPRCGAWLRARPLARRRDRGRTRRRGAPESRRRPRSGERPAHRWRVRRPR